MSEFIMREIDCGLATRQEIVGELVRCKDCKWHEDNFCGNYNVIGFGNDDYCSLGERKDD